MLTTWPRASIVRGTQVTLPHGPARGRTTRLGGGPRRIVNARRQIGEAGRRFGTIALRDAHAAARRHHTTHQQFAFASTGAKYSVFHSCGRAARDGFSRMMAERELQRARGSRESICLLQCKSIRKWPHSPVNLSTAGTDVIVRRLGLSSEFVVRFMRGSARGYHCSISFARLHFDARPRAPLATYPANPPRGA